MLRETKGHASFQIDEMTGEPLVEDSVTKLVRELSRLPHRAYFCHGVAKRVIDSEVVLFCSIGSEKHARKMLGDLQVQSRDPSGYSLKGLKPGDVYIQRFQLSRKPPTDILLTHGTTAKEGGPRPDGRKCG